MWKEIDCSTLANASRPIEIYNSNYYLVFNNCLCCPLESDHCLPERVVRRECARRNRKIVDDPCFQCKTCGKLIGETCYGVQGTEGLCEEGLKCIGNEGENKTGVCTVDQEDLPVVRGSAGEVCGGRLNSLGVCREGLECRQIMEGRPNVCVMAGQ